MNLRVLIALGRWLEAEFIFGQNTRDGKLIWAKKDTNDNSWEDSSKFGDLVFTPIDMLAIEPQGKLWTVWGKLKR